VNRGFAICAAQLSLVGILAACSPGEPPPSETVVASPMAGEARDAGGAPEARAAREACSLITVEEATKILGSPATASAGRSSQDRSACDYVTQSYQSFTLEAIWSGAEDEIKTARTAAEAAARQVGGTEDKVVDEVMGLRRVDGLGDEAYFARRTMSYVRKGDVLLVFHMSGLDEPARENWEALARAALARL